jgi:hypothetical protein
MLSLVCAATIAGAPTQAERLRQPPAVEAVLAGARCEPAARARLREWQANLAQALTEPAGPTGARAVRMPTSALGIWVRLTRDRPGALTIERITSTRVERLELDEACETSEFAVATGPVVPGAFTDSELITLVARAERGVFLLWSPHMPLSVDQHAVLAEVARELDLRVVPLLDPGADPAYAAAVARERGLAAGATRPLGGIELAYRGMTTHTPSLQLFAGGRLIGPVLYGYRNAAALRESLRAVLTAP